MCRIFAVQGSTPAVHTLLEGISRLEYGGYDSAGLALFTPQGISVEKTVGKVADLKKCVEENPLEGTTGIAHTRWATNGGVTKANSHPHLSSDGRVAVVHNGILDSSNEKHLRGELAKDGVTFVSETDTEVIANVIAQELRRGANSLEDAVARSAKRMQGAYAIVVMSEVAPGELVAMKQSSPLSVGINGTSVFVASDPIAFAGYASHKVDLNNGEIVTLAGGKFRFRGRDPEASTQCLEKYDVPPEHVSKGGYPHFMLKEIMEQGEALEVVLTGRLRAGGVVRLGGIEDERIEARIVNARRIMLVGCGTAYHAALLGKTLIEDLAGIPVEVQYAHEFRTSVLSPHDVVIAISQSGETMDTIMAVRAAKKKRALCLAINNREGSTLSKEVEAGIYLRAGPEISVASTKAFTAQVAVLLLLSIKLAQLRGKSLEELEEIAESLRALPSLITEVVNKRDQIRRVAQRICKAKTILYLGRGYGVPIAEEGALKLKEVAYLNAEGHPGGELMHGFLALVEKGLPTIALLGDDAHTQRMISSMQKVQARGGSLIVVRSGNTALPEGLAEEVIDLPSAAKEVMPILSVIPLQLLAYEVGVALGLDVDQPRNLAKSVTVE